MIVGRCKQGGHTLAFAASFVYRELESRVIHGEPDVLVFGERPWVGRGKLELRPSAPLRERRGSATRQSRCTSSPCTCGFLGQRQHTSRSGHARVYQGSTASQPPASSRLCDSHPDSEPTSIASSRSQLRIVASLSTLAYNSQSRSLFTPLHASKLPSYIPRATAHSSPLHHLSDLVLPIHPRECGPHCSFCRPLRSLRPTSLSRSNPPSYNSRPHRTTTHSSTMPHWTY